MRDFDIPFIEEPYELNLDIDKLDFKRVSVETTNYSGKLYDLEIENTLENRYFVLFSTEDP